jgi:hypothetical protein
MFEYLFGPENPTKEWQRAKDLRLDFDLEQKSLNGVRLGGPLERLSFLGSIEDRTGLRSQELRYPSLGLRVYCYNDENVIDCFEIVQRDPWSPQVRPFPGLFHYRGRQLSLSQLTERDFVTLFGFPYWRDEDEDEVILFYEFSELEWQVEFSLDGSFNCICVTSKPLLADENQRTAYGVTEQWPPSFGRQVVSD